MITLVMDTAYKHLVLGIYRDGELLAGTAEVCFKKQSETIFVELEKLLEKCGLKLSDVNEVVITDGPGSYTGLRIAMTVAKIMGAMADVRVCTISTMQLYAGLAEKANVILDARGKRAYTAHLENGEVLFDAILPVSELPAFLESHPGTLYGDGELVGMEAEQAEFLKNAADLRDLYQEVENIHALVPRYYKESDAYKV